MVAMLNADGSDDADDMTINYDDHEVCEDTGDADNEIDEVVLLKSPYKDLFQNWNASNIIHYHLQSQSLLFSKCSSNFILNIQSGYAI